MSKMYNINCFTHLSIDLFTTVESLNLNGFFINHNLINVENPNMTFLDEEYATVMFDQNDSFNFQILCSNCK